MRFFSSASLRLPRLLAPLTRSPCPRSRRTLGVSIIFIRRRRRRRRHRHRRDRIIHPLPQVSLAWRHAWRNSIDLRRLRPLRCIRLYVRRRRRRCRRACSPMYTSGNTFGRPGSFQYASIRQLSRLRRLRWLRCSLLIAHSIMTLILGADVPHSAPRQSGLLIKSGPSTGFGRIMCSASTRVLQMELAPMNFLWPAACTAPQVSPGQRPT